MKSLSQTTRPRLEPSWLEVLSPEFEKPYMRKLRAFLVEEVRNQRVYPPGKEVFNAFWLTPFEKVRVVILGQDPYHDSGQAHDLCFSVRKDVPAPPSLQNIFAELHQDMGFRPPDHGDLSSWARQGVLLLNTVLTVRSRQPKSHAGQGWETFTDKVITELNTRRDSLVFILWGASAGRKVQMVDQRKHLVLRSPHPSPYSADRGFFGCRHFSKANLWLEERNIESIDWRL